MICTSLPESDNGDIFLVPVKRLIVLKNKLINLKKGIPLAIVKVKLKAPRKKFPLIC